MAEQKRLYVRGPLEVRFWAHVSKGDGCWEWMGARTNAGHGTVNVGGGRFDRAHRVAWRLAHGEIPDGHVVRHRCDNARCVRPEHLELGTQRDNIHDMMSRGRGRGQFQRRAQCSKGHPIEQVRGYRRCRTCRREECRRRRAAKHEAA